MRRPDLLTAASASLAALAAPRIGRAERPNPFPPKISACSTRFLTGIRSTRNHAYLVFDTLYGVDTSWTAQPPGRPGL